ncbi:hypothetical protein EIP86_005672 [Pleurotus ostreatoroseus]|nr:hypothetical protein EIP86_005672 [Pleurotus ostreatoroseus]
MVQRKLRLLTLERQHLQNRLCELEVEIQEHQCLLTKPTTPSRELVPIERLPPEILLQIFSFSVHQEDDEQLGLALVRRPFTLSHVCQQWRSLSLTASDLWTSLVFNSPSAVNIFVARSKERPVDIIHVADARIEPSSTAELYRPLVTTRKRWHDVFWEGSYERMRSLLLVLNYDKTNFPHLHTLDLRVQARDSPCKPILVQTFGSVRFPQLSRLLLSGISPTELPPSTAHRLRRLHVHFPVPRPYPSNPLLPPYFRMSSFCAYLAKTVQLETLIMEDCTPLMDVYLHPDPGHHMKLDSSSVTPIRAILPTSAVLLTAVRRFDWTSAPPKDLWRLFHFLKMPALRQLDISLGKVEDRWFSVQDRVIAPMLSSHPLSLNPVNLLLEFDALQELRVTCCDAEGLSSSLRKMAFPALSKLELFYDEMLVLSGPPSRKTEPVPCPKLPPLESIFREPRLVKLTQLTLYGFVLEMSATTAMLAYMPALQELYMDSCRGTVSIALRRVTVVTSATLGAEKAPVLSEITRDSDKTVKKWKCPQLEMFAVEHCPNLRFRWLENLFAARKCAAAEIRATSAQRVIRPLPSSRRILLGTGQSTANTSLLATPRRPNVAPRVVGSPSCSVMSSPNGSFVAGWNPHEPVDSTISMTLRVKDCRRVSAAEMISLEGRYGITNTSWDA